MVDHPPGPPSRMAFVDESESDSRHDPDVYLLGAVVVALPDLERLRQEIDGLRATRGRKLHWTKADDSTRSKLAGFLARSPIACYVALHEGRSGERPERRRRLCLETLLHTLESEAVTTVVAESRGPGDRKDRSCVDGLRRAKLIRQLRLSHVGGPVEPLLWAADALCGAMVRSRAGDQRFISPLTPRLTVLRTRDGRT